MKHTQAELARLRQALYRLFGALFLYPDRERLANLIAATRELQAESDSLVAFPFFRPWRRLRTTLQALSPATDEGATAEVEEAYVRLFLVNPQAPPYESFYLDPQRRVVGWIVAQLEREYTEKGLTLVPSVQTPPDHAAVELEFMAFLCNQEAQTWQEENSAAGVQALEWQRAFLGQHLGRWFPAFTRQVAAAGQDGLYAVAAVAADAFIHHDRDLVALLLERLQATDAGNVQKGGP